MLAQCSIEELTMILDNHQTLSGGTSKPAAIVEAAAALSAVGVRHARDLDPNSEVHEAAYNDIRGLGRATWVYFTMLLGSPGIKADRWIGRFVSAGLERDSTPRESEALLNNVATELGVDARDLDYAVWSYMSTK